MNDLARVFGRTGPIIASFLLLFAPAASAAPQANRPDLPDFDRRTQTPATPVVPPAQREAARAALRARVPGVSVDFDPITGSPSWITVQNGFLTGTNGAGGIAPESLAEFPATDPHRVVRAFLKDYQALFGHGPEVLDTARIKREFVTAHNGMRTVVWEQQVDGVPVFESLLIAHTTKNGELVNLSSRFLPSPDAAATVGTPDRTALLSNPRISGRGAVASAAQSLGETLPAAQVSARSVAQGPEHRQSFESAVLKGGADAHLVWLPLNGNSLRLCWEVILTSRARGEMFRVLIDASNGEALLRQSLTERLSNASYRVFTTPSAAPFTLGYPTNLGGAVTVSGLYAPATNQPPQVARVLVVTSALDTNASPNGWINDGTNVTTSGNNASAYLDVYATGNPDIPPPQGTTNRAFDFPLDLTQDPTTYSNTSVVNLFYWNNWMHDKLYGLGFTEAAGNFQSNNFGRGGLSGDPVLAEAQEGYYNNSTNQQDNASFSTPPDGSPGIMEMYVFAGPAPPLDADFDTEVILHEYTHGLSNRRVGGGVGITAPQSKGLGEGWSDFYSLALLSQPADDVNGCYPEGPYVTYLLPGNTTNLTQNYYFGIRRYPYSTSLTNDPVTFKDIDPNQASPHTGVPVNPVIVNTAAEIHAQGEIWCAALWDARANLINKYGFATGNQLMLQLVTDGMNLTPANPTFPQARDAILQADLVDDNAANNHELWLAFAKRGLGLGASATNGSATTLGVVESFVVPDYLLLSPGADFLTGGPIGGPFSPSSQSYGLHNTSTNVMNWAAAATVPWVSLSATNGTLAAAGGSTNVLVSLNPAANTLALGTYNGTLVFTNLNTSLTQTFNLSLTVSLPLIYSFPLNTDPGWARQGQWAFGHPTGQGGASFGNPDPAAGATGTNVFGVNLNGDYSINPAGPFYLTTGPLNLSTFAGVTLQFQRWLNTDSQPYGFATIDVSNDGTNWTNVFQNPGDMPVTDSAWTQCAYDISSVADHQPSVYVRWGYQTTSGVFPYSGWNLDDIQFRGLSQITVLLPASATEGAGLLAGQGHVSVAQAPAANLAVQLASSDTSRVTVPASATILAGQTNAAFDLTVQNIPGLDGTGLVNITATGFGYATGVGTLPVYDADTATLTVSLPPSAGAGAGAIQGTVTVSGTPVRDITVSLASSLPSSLQVPSTVVISNGQTSAMFTANVPATTLIDDVQPTVTAHMMNWTNGVASMIIQGSGNTNLALTLPAQARESNGTLTNAGRAQISGTLSSNLTVTLLPSNTSKLTTPPTVTILAGQTSAVFNVTLVSGNLPHNPIVVGVAASAPGFNGTGANVYIIDNGTPPAPFNPRPPDLSTTNPVTLTLCWNNGVGEGVEYLANGGFESGGISPWFTPPDADAGFIINDGTIFPPSGDSPTTPYAGNFSALADPAPPAITIMCQQVSLPTNAGAITLSWVDRVRNFNAAFDTNQQFRVEIRDTNNAVLAVAFSTQPGDPLLADWTQRSASLSSYGGRTVRLAFVVNAGLDFLDVHLDEVSVKCSTLPPATNDVYFGTNPTPGAPQLLGSTTNTYWTLPKLAPFTTYYWQIVARRANQTAGPVWQFSSLPTLSINNVQLLEGDDGTTTNAVFTVSLSDTNSQAITVDYATADGTATAATDYGPTNGTLTFNPGTTNSQTITVTVIGNNLPEPNKTFFVNLSNVQNAALAANQAVGTILNDDHYPVIQSIVVAAGQVTLHWSSDNGKTYRVQYSNDLISGWNDLPGDVPATGPTSSKVDSSGLTTKRYYRVRMLL